MPKLLRLSGVDVIRILEGFGFEVSRIKGSHHRLTRVTDAGKSHLTIPVHGKRPIPIGTLKQIYREACRYIDEDKLKLHFYG